MLTFKTLTIYYILLLPRIDFEMVCVNTNDTHHILRAIFRSLIREKYDKHKIIFTDGSKSEEGGGSAAIMGVKRETVSFPRVSTIFTAEMIALRLAVKLVRSGSLEDNYLIWSDLLSALQELNNVMTYDHLVHRVQLEFHQIITSGYVTLMWVPSHVGIQGNEIVDI